jgi:hypothetical protein
MQKKMYGIKLGLGNIREKSVLKREFLGEKENSFFFYFSEGCFVDKKK